MKRLRGLILRLEGMIDRPWAVPGLALLAFADLFVMVIPTEGILVSTVMLRPRRWLSICLWFVTLSALGAGALGLVVQRVAVPAAEQVLEADESRARVERLIDDYGPPALAAISISPLPQQPAVAIAAAGKMKLGMIVAMVWLGRFIKYFFFAWVASHAPRLLRRLPLIERELKALERP